MKYSTELKALDIALIVMIFVVGLGLQQTSWAQASSSSLKKEFQTLGDNKKLMERAQLVDGTQKVRVVQNRLVDRNNRLELSIGAGQILGGDSYVNSQAFTGQAFYHINPQWVIGVEYASQNNTLSTEAERKYNDALACQKQDPFCTLTFPQIDYVKSSQTALLQFYPIYGKMNVFDRSVVQFDMYTTLGFGQKTLNTGTSNHLLAGFGIGVWWNQYITNKFEVRYESFKDLIKSDERNQSQWTLMATLGVFVW